MIKNFIIFLLPPVLMYIVGAFIAWDAVWIVSIGEWLWIQRTFFLVVWLFVWALGTCGIGIIYDEYEKELKEKESRKETERFFRENKNKVLHHLTTYYINGIRCSKEEYEAHAGKSMAELFPKTFS